jgi:hypothetical protein
VVEKYLKGAEPVTFLFGHFYLVIFLLLVILAFGICFDFDFWTLGYGFLNSFI